MRNISISVDVEPEIYTKKYTSLEQSMQRLSSLLKKRDIKVTLFVTCDCIEKFPNLFRKLHKEGHEIAAHGYRHIRMNDLTTKEKEEQIKKSIQCFEKYLKFRPKGFRAPQHSIDDEMLSLLQKYGFKYDSSYSPWNFYHMLFSRKMIQFKHNFTKRGIYEIRDGFYEIPLTAFVLPFSGITLRILNKLFFNMFLKLIFFTKNPVFLIHSWDLIELPNSKMYKRCPLDLFINKLNQLLEYYPKLKFKRLEQLVPPI